MSKTSPTEIDLKIGRNIKLKRIKAGKSLQDLADVLNVSFQQIQKYERGQNKISSGNLFLLSEFLETDIEYFFDGLSTNTDNAHSQFEEENDAFEHIVSIPDHELTSLVRSYSQVNNSTVRKKMLDLIKSLSQAEDLVQSM